MTLAWTLLQFVVCAALIARAGLVLCRSADALAEAHGWGRGWVGLALLATVTSLPELAAGISAAAWVGAPDLAVGNALGACVLNLLFIAVVDALRPQPPMYHQAGAVHRHAATIALVMLGLVIAGLLLGPRAPTLGAMGAGTLLLPLLYLAAVRGTHQREQQAAAATAGTAAPVSAAAAAAPAVTPALRTPWWRRFVLAALVVLAAGSWLPGVAADLARALGWSTSFIGTVLVSVVTTLPEAAVTLAALRLGALDMAIGNLLGSTLFNLLVLAVDDAVHAPGPILATVAGTHLGTALTAAVMTALVLAGLVRRPPRGRWPRRAPSWVALALAAAAVSNAARVYLGGGA